MLLKFVKSNFFELILLTAFKGISANKKREKVTKEIICVRSVKTNQKNIPSINTFHILPFLLTFPMTTQSSHGGLICQIIYNSSNRYRSSKRNSNLGPKAFSLLEIERTSETTRPPQPVFVTPYWRVFIQHIKLCRMI